MTNIIQSLQNLTYDDLAAWAGGTILERGKGLSQKVTQLHLNNKGQLNAQVQGGELYDCRIFLDDLLDSTCSCPYSGGHCKHAVAVILAAAKVLKAGQDIPTQAPEENTQPTAKDQNRQDKDARIKAIRETLTYSGLTIESVLALTSPNQLYTHKEPDEHDAEEEEDVDFYTQEYQPLRRTLTALTKGKLVQLLMDMAEDNPDDLLFDLRDRADALSAIDPKKHITSLRSQIKKITAQESWQNHWDKTGFTPNYSPIKRGLTALLEQGQCDEVIELGKELWRLGIIQAGNAGDEGETAEQLCSAMQPVFTALPNSAMAPVDQLLWLIDHELSDEFCILDNMNLPYDHPSYQAAEWRAVVVILRERLNNQRKTFANKTPSFQDKYYYKQLLQHVLYALEKLEDQNTILAIIEDSLSITEDYLGLAKTYLALNQPEKAKHWMIQGYKNTSAGMASSLKKHLVEQWQKEGKYHEVAALLADNYFTRPNLDVFKQLETLCQPLTIWPPVREKLLHYLQDATLPETDWDDSIWPLPVPLLTQLDYNANRRPSKNKAAKPSFPLLLEIDIALYEQRFSEAAELFDKQSEQLKYQSNTAAVLARKASATHPELAMTIWLNKAEAEISKVNPKNYPVAGEYLREIRLICQQHNTLPRWDQILNDVRQRHKAKKRLQVVLDRLVTPGEKLIT